MNTNRRYQRFVAGTPTYVRFRGDSSNVGGYVTNVSEGGAFVRCTTPVEVGRDLVCAFQLGSQQFKCRGRVVWVPTGDTRRSVGPGFGVSFTVPQPAFERLLGSHQARAAGAP